MSRETQREGQIHREWKQGSQKDIQCTNISPKEIQTTPHANRGRENLNVPLQKSEKRRLTLSWYSVFKKKKKSTELALELCRETDK